MEKKTVYVVVGIGYPYDMFEDAYSIVSEHAVWSTFEKAQKEFDEIVAEVEKEAQEQGYGYKVSYNADKDYMWIDFDSGTKEIYRIHEKTIDFI